MQVFEYTITDPVGLHARPAANLSRAASELTSAVKVRKKDSDKEGDAKSMLAVMSLGIRTNDTAVFTVAGDAEEADAEALKAFCKKEL